MSMNLTAGCGGTMSTSEFAKAQFAGAANCTPKTAVLSTPVRWDDWDELVRRANNTVGSKFNALA